MDRQLWIEVLHKYYLWKTEGIVAQGYGFSRVGFWVFAVLDVLFCDFLLLFIFLSRDLVWLIVQKANWHPSCMVGKAQIPSLRLAQQSGGRQAGGRLTTLRLRTGRWHFKISVHVQEPCLQASWLYLLFSIGSNPWDFIFI